VADIIPPRRDEQLTTGGIPTLRTSEFFEELTNNSNVTLTTVSSTTQTAALALIFALENRIGSGDALTSDETGFTVDSTKLTVDQTEA